MQDIKKIYDKYNIKKNEVTLSFFDKFVSFSLDNIKCFVCKDKYQYDLFTIFCLFKYNEKINYLGIDMEFNNIDNEPQNKIIALIQLSFFYGKFKYVWIINPFLMSKNSKKIFVDMLLNNKLYKIFHGSDSLDLPLLYKYILQNNKKKMIIFMQHVFDTRFLCEFYKILINYIDRKCSLYEGLIYYKSITQKLYAELNKNEEKISLDLKTNWNIKNLTYEQIKYAFHDSIHLKKFFFDIIKHIKKITNDFYIINFNISLFRFVTITKLVLFNDFDKIKKNIDAMNNYFIINKGDNMRLIEIYENIINNININEINISNFLNINYFKKILSIVLKFITYYIMTKYYVVYKMKNIKLGCKINFNIIINLIKKTKTIKLINYLNELYKNIEKNIISFYNI